MPGLRDEPRFVRWAVAEGISMVGTTVSTVVLPIVVYDATGSATLTGGLFALRVVPYLLFGAIAGPIADRWNRRILIIGGNVAEGVLVATIPIAHALGVLTVAQVYVVGLLSATAFVFSDAAVFGAVPALVGRDRIAAANGLLGSMASIAEIFGPTIGGILATTIEPTNAVWIDAASFLVAAAVQSTIRSDFRDSPRTSGPLRVRAQLKRAFGFVRGNRTIATLFVVGFGNSLAFGAVLGLLVPYAIEQVGLTADDSRIGLFYTAGGVGALVAGATLARLFRPERVKWITPLMIALSTVAIWILVVIDQVWPAIAVLVSFGWSVGTTIQVGITYRQIAAPDDLRSSINVLGRMISWGGQPFGAAIGAAVAGAVSVQAAYTVAGSVGALSAIAAFALLPASTALDDQVLATP